MDAKSQAKQLWFCVCVWSCMSITGYAQGTTGTISGMVNDTTGAVVPGVSVKAMNVETGVTRETVTDAAGRYRIPQLALGLYTVQAQVGGFQTEVRSGIRLTVGQEAVVNLELRVGAVTERVEVTGEAPLVQTKDSAVSYLVDENTMRDLPLNGRNFVSLALMQPNVVQNSYLTTLSAGNGVNLIVQGQRAGANLFLIDGTEANDYIGKTPGGAAGSSLGVEAIREFSLLTGNYSAEYGHFMGGVVNVVTRSGTNELHGNLFEFLRNSVLDAKNFFDPLRDAIPPFKRNQFGGTLGGPIKKDRAFYFGNYEGLREVKSLTQVALVPSRDAHQGILPSGAVTIHPSIRPLLDVWPLPNGRDNRDGSAEFIGNPSQPSDEDYFMARTDYQISNSHSLFGRYAFDDSRQSRPETPPVFTDNGKVRYQYVTVSETSLFGPATLNVFRGGFTRSMATFSSSDLASFPQGFTFLAGVPKVGPWVIQAPSMNVGSCSGCRREDPRYFTLNVLQADDKVSLQRGAHSFSFGGTVNRYQFNEVSSSGGQYGQHTFQSITDFLAARPISFLGFKPGFGDQHRAIRQTLFGIFVQDDYQVTSHLTLNLGLRYEFATSPVERNGKMATVINPPTDTALSFPKEYFLTTKKNFAPRLGFAWDPSGKGKTSIRGGMGVFYNIITPTTIEIGIRAAQQPPFTQNVTLTTQQGDILFPRALERAGLNLPSVALDVDFFDREAKAPTRYFWTVGVQQEMFAKTIMAATYSGSNSTHLIFTGDMNIALPTRDSSGQVFFPPSLPRRNPAFGSLSRREWAANSNYHALALNVARRFARGFQGQIAYTWSRNLDNGSTLFGGGASSPEAVNAAGNPQFFYDRAVERGLSSYHIAHSFVSNVTWIVPLGTHAGLAGRVLEGWQLSGIFTRHSGIPATALVGFLRSRSVPTGSGSDRPNLASGKSNNPVLGGPDKYFDPTAFELPPAGYFGNLGRGTIIGPGFVALDFSAVKKTWITEKTNLEFRAEVFNIFNHPNFGQMLTGIFTPTGARQGSAGRLASTLNSSRQIQFGLKLNF